MLKPILRTKSIGTKVTEEEYARLEALAGASGPEYERVGGDVLLAELESKAAEGTEATVLAELLGFRWAVQRPPPACGLRVPPSRGCNDGQVGSIGGLIAIRRITGYDPPAASLGPCFS